jgi:hypothetical protein
MERGEDGGKAIDRFRRKIAANDLESFVLQLAVDLLSGCIGGWPQEDADRSGAFRVLLQQAVDDGQSQFSRADDKGSGGRVFCFWHQVLLMILMAK